MDGYFAEPYSAFTLDKMHLAGLIVLGALGMLSVTALLPVIIFITMRLVAVPQVKHNQPIVLCFNLLLADLFQAMSFLASFHWVVEGGILAPSGWCHVQGALLNIGDLSSGFFVSFIALHTAWTIVRGRSLSHRIFTIIICCIWAVAVILTTIGPLKFGQKFFVRAGNWCWISPAYETERLVFHYLWTFVNEFGTIVVYALLFIYLHRKLTRLRQVRPDVDAPKSIGRAARYMILYPLVFVIATLPLAVGRMLTANDHSPSDQYFFGAGALLASCGWLDAVLYTATRRVLLRSGPGGDGSSLAIGSGGNRTTWHGGWANGSMRNPFPMIDSSSGRASKTLSSMTWGTESKSPVKARQPESDEVELVSPRAFNHSRAETMEGSINMPSVGTWPLPPAVSPSLDEDLETPMQRHTMVRIEEEPRPGQAPRKYWRMEPAKSALE